MGQQGPLSPQFPLAFLKSPETENVLDSAPGRVLQVFPETMEDYDMAVRAKFRVEKIECSHQTKYKTGVDGKPDYKQTYLVEMRTVHMQPVWQWRPEP